jgi:hypothetical protein
MDDGCEALIFGDVESISRGVLLLRFMRPDFERFGASISVLGRGHVMAARMKMFVDESMYG